LEFSFRGGTGTETNAGGGEGTSWGGGLREGAESERTTAVGFTTKGEGGGVFVGVPWGPVVIRGFGFFSQHLAEAPGR